MPNALSRTLYKTSFFQASAFGAGACGQNTFDQCIEDCCLFYHPLFFAYFAPPADHKNYPGHRTLFLIF